ncbi:MAG TPA: HNH endonuclease signature motif containing protein [Tepidisphaeraceae bacterium]
MPEEDIQCSLCRRSVPKRLITLHHLKPKSRGGKAEHRVPLCKPCHKQIHATFDNRTLDKELADLEKLRLHPLLEPFMKWIVKQAPERNFATRTSGAHTGGSVGRIRRRSR